MSDYIYTQHKVTAEQSKVEVKNYTMLGYQEYIDDEDKPRVSDNSDKIFAKTILANQRVRHFVKVGAYGKLFNPMGMFSEGQENKFLSKIGKNAFEFKEVNMRIFDLYLNFLTSKNIAWLNNAQREML